MSVVRQSCTAALLVLAGGCSTLPTSISESPDARSAPTQDIQPEVAPDGRFAVAASMLDTWNAIGQILVALDGVR